MTKRFSHFEAVANSVIGIVLMQSVLFLFGIQLHEAIALNITIICVSCARSFVLRVIFESINERRRHKILTQRNIDERRQRREAMLRDGALLAQSLERGQDWP